MHGWRTETADLEALVALGVAVRSGRRRKGWSQRELAMRATVSQSAVSRIERGILRGTAMVLFARLAWALADGLPLGGCPHGHGCAWERAYAQDLERVVPSHPAIQRARLAGSIPWEDDRSDDDTEDADDADTADDGWARLLRASYPLI